MGITGISCEGSITGRDYYSKTPSEPSEEYHFFLAYEHEICGTMYRSSKIITSPHSSGDETWSKIIVPDFIESSSFSRFAITAFNKI